MSDLRSELLPPTVDENLQKQVENLIEDIADTGKTMSERENALAKLNQLLKPDEPFDFYRFQEYWSYADLEEVAQEAIRRIPKVDISYEELKKILETFGRGEDSEFYVSLLQKNFSFPAISDLIYWPNELPRYGEEFDFGFDIENGATVDEMTDIIWEYEKTRDISRFKRNKS